MLELLNQNFEKVSVQRNSVVTQSCTCTSDAARAAASAAAAAQSTHLSWSITLAVSDRLADASSAPHGQSGVTADVEFPAFVVGGGPVMAAIGRGNIAAACIKGIARSVALESPSSSEDGGQHIQDGRNARHGSILSSLDTPKNYVSEPISAALREARGRSSAGAGMKSVLMPSRCEPVHVPFFPMNARDDSMPYQQFVSTLMQTSTEESITNTSGSKLFWTASDWSNAASSATPGQSAPSSVRIIGGMGAIGVAVSEWLLAGSGARWVTLTGRSGRYEHTYLTYNQNEQHP